jgi:putative transposase
MTAALPQGELTIARMCALAAISRAGYYRHWRASAPRQEETGLRDVIQRLALADRHCGYRRITAQLRREGFATHWRWHAAMDGMHASSRASPVSSF